MVEASAQVPAFERIRPRLLEHLMAVRASFDPALARADDARARAQLTALVTQLGTFLATGDVALHRGALQSMLVQRGRAAGGAAQLVSTLVGVGDLAARVAVEQLGDDGHDLAIAITRRTATTVRLCSELLVEELGQRAGQRAVLATWGAR
ncbi:MAG: hypothetical protein R2939_21265 [Kofleriaceae bacterium]